MLQQLELQDFLELANSANRVAVYREIPADCLTPIAIVEHLTEEMRDGSILESGLDHHDAGRYSYIAFDAIAQLRVANKRVMARIGSQTDTSHANPFTVLRNMLAKLNFVGMPVAFMNTAVGFISYDAVRLFEAIPERHLPDSRLPDMIFNFYQTHLIFDHVQQKLLISRIVDITTPNYAEIYHDAQEKIAALIEKIRQPKVISSRQSSSRKITEMTSDLSDEHFIQLIKEAKKYIVAGDAFQIVLSRCFKQAYSVHPFAVYRALRRVSPAPYMFYLPFENRVIVGASPEKLISVRDRQVSINPIAGTRGRNATSNDLAIETDLLADVKERAEHIMLVDLARNDLGAVCQPGSITVNKLMQVKHFSHVSHITSNITGQLRQDKDALDALAAAFPAGTLSGAPKIRAMEIIDQLETSRRELYGGAICRIDNQGNLDSCIAIRMAQLEDGMATIRAGAGIVYDSDPAVEADETRHKASAMLAALKLAEEESHDFNY